LEVDEDRTVDEDQIRRGHRATRRGMERESAGEQAQLHVEDTGAARLVTSLDSMRA
jgi:hypothetical protein